MPSTKDKNVVRAIGSNGGGAGEPSGEPAPPPGILDSVPDDLRRQLPDEVVDELLAGARTEEEIVGPGGLSAGNPAQRLSLRFTPAGVMVGSGGLRARFGLWGVGRSGAMVRVRPVGPRATGARVSYGRGLVREWYVNGPLGLSRGLMCFG